MAVKQNRCHIKLFTTGQFLRTSKSFSDTRDQRVIFVCIKVYVFPFSEYLPSVFLPLNRLGFDTQRLMKPILCTTPSSYSSSFEALKVSRHVHEMKKR